MLRVFYGEVQRTFVRCRVCGAASLLRAHVQPVSFLSVGCNFCLIERASFKLRLGRPAAAHDYGPGCSPRLRAVVRHLSRHSTNWLGLLMVMIALLYDSSVQTALGPCTCSAVSAVLNDVMVFEVIEWSVPRLFSIQNHTRVAVL